jgi:tRNA-specific 2-thiouridylase
MNEASPDSLSGTVAVAMSGGLDSSVVAWLLARQAAETGGISKVVGLSMLLWDHSLERRNGRCCGALDLADAQRVAAQVGIPHYTLQMDVDFRRTVVDPFVQDYLDGRTPSPCVRCNTWVKFDLFVERARALGAEAIATGHYARILHGDDGPELHTALDEAKDQSYFLFELSQEQLAVARFPLGGMPKSAVRDLAREAGLVVAEKGESMEVCFVTSGVREFVDQQIELHPGRYSLPVSAAAAATPDMDPETEPATGAMAATGGMAAASVVDQQGRVLGESRDPYYRYTVGQRRGLDFAAGRRLYVLSVDAEHNQVTVGDDDALLEGGLEGERVHWIGEPLKEQALSGPIEATVKIRSRHDGVRALIHDRGHGGCDIEFDTRQRGVTPGQAAVFYQGTRVLGGCWIERA